jgi:hypothetical protein
MKTGMCDGRLALWRAPLGQCQSSGLASKPGDRRAQRELPLRGRIFPFAEPSGNARYLRGSRRPAIAGWRRADAPHIHDIIVSRDVAIMGLAWALTVISDGESAVGHERGFDSFRQQPEGQWATDLGLGRPLTDLTAKAGSENYDDRTTG